MNPDFIYHVNIFCWINKYDFNITIIIFEYFVSFLAQTKFSGSVPRRHF